MSRWGRALLAVALALAGAACSRPANDERRPAPPLTGGLLDGGTYNLADHLGDVVVVNFWASWCGPCRVEIDDLQAVHESTKDDGVSFVGINIRDDRGKAQAFVDGRVTYPSLFDPSGKLSIGYAELGATTIPATVIVDRQGRVAKVLREAIVRDTFAPLVLELAKEPRP